MMMTDIISQLTTEKEFSWTLAKDSKWIDGLAEIDLSDHWLYNVYTPFGMVLGLWTMRG